MSSLLSESQSPLEKAKAFSEISNSPILIFSFATNLIPLPFSDLISILGFIYSP